IVSVFIVARQPAEFSVAVFAVARNGCMVGGVHFQPHGSAAVRDCGLLGRLQQHGGNPPPARMRSNRNGIKSADDRAAPEEHNRGAYKMRILLRNQHLRGWRVEQALKAAPRQAIGSEYPMLERNKLVEIARRGIAHGDFWAAYLGEVGAHGLSVGWVLARDQCFQFALLPVLCDFARDTTFMVGNRSMRHGPLRAIALALMLIPSAAFAHPGGVYAYGFEEGFAHPFAGADHILAMVTVGIFAWQLGGRAIWLVPSTFVLLMGAGGALARMGIALPSV